MAFRLLVFVAINSVDFLVLMFLGTRDERLCHQKASIFMRRTDEMARRLVMSPINEDK